MACKLFFSTTSFLMALSNYRPRDDAQGNSCFRILFSPREYARINDENVKGKFP